MFSFRQLKMAPLPGFLTVAVFLALALSSFGVCSSSTSSSYLDKREHFIEKEDSMRLGQRLNLNPVEEEVNKILMKWKEEEIKKAIDSKDHPYTASLNFLDGKKYIDQSKIYQVIKKMPKGAALHVHSTAMTSVKWLIKNFAYSDNLYYKTESNRYVYTTSADKVAKDPEFKNVVKAREESSKCFDERLLRDFTLSKSNSGWDGLNHYFTARRQMVGKDNDRDIECVMQGIKEFYDDGVFYLEIRTSNLDEEFFDKLKVQVKSFKETHHNFIGIRFIIAQPRELRNKRILKGTKKTMELMTNYKDFVMGYDLVGQEDKGRLTISYINTLVKGDSSKLPYFFHSGETDWTQDVDENLVDSVLLNSKRIGHGFAALRHPLVMETIKNKHIAIELNPISNQVLGLVSDLRNHPGAVMFAENDPVVVSSDDPVVWKASPLSHDFYMAFMALGSTDDDLRLLKQLALNSFKYSTLKGNHLKKATNIWKEAWDDFIKDIYANHSSIVTLPLAPKSECDKDGSWTIYGRVSYISFLVVVLHLFNS